VFDPEAYGGWFVMKKRLLWFDKSVLKLTNVNKDCFNVTVWNQRGINIANQIELLSKMEAHILDLGGEKS